MNMTTKLSVSSAILAAVLSGCSQQQVIGGSQVSGGSYSGGSQQVAGGSQVAGGGSQQQIEGGSSQVGGSQQQVEAATPVVVQPRVVTRAPIHVYKPQPVQRRIYTRGPKPRVTRSVKRSGLGLPAAQPGQCFAKVKVPATYKTQSRRILIQKATATRKLVRAPQYRWVNKKVLVRKASYRTRTIPAQYKTVTKRVMVKPAYNTWKKGHGAITRIDNMTGQIMCRVKVPAVYKNVSRRVLVRKAQTQRTLVPAIYKTVKQKQFVAAAQYRTVRTPARYKTQNYRVKASSAKYVWRAVLCQTNAPKHYKKAAPKKHYRAAPKQYRKAVVKRKAVVRKAYKKQYRPRQSTASGINYQDYLKVMRASVPKATKLKKTKKHSKKVVLKKRSMKSKMKAKAPVKNMMKKSDTKPQVMKKSPAVSKSTSTKQAQAAKSSSKKSIVYGIQKALKDKGFDPGAMDGKMGPGTAAALKAFQSSHGLPVGQLNKDTFRALGLIR